MASKVSTRDEKCGECGDPLFVCPSTIRRFVRCCGECTHYTEHDMKWEAEHPGQPRRTPTTNGAN